MIRAHLEPDGERRTALSPLVARKTQIEIAERTSERDRADGFARELGGPRFQMVERAGDGVRLWINTPPTF